MTPPPEVLYFNVWKQEVEERVFFLLKGVYNIEADPATPMKLGPGQDGSIVTQVIVERTDGLNHNDIDFF